MTPNDHSSWLAQILEEYEGQLTRYAYRITGDLERARDVVQETFLSLWRARQKEEFRYAPAWLFTVCRNKALDVNKKETKMISVGQGAEVGDLNNPAQKLEAKQDQSRLMRELTALKPQEQEVIRLKFQNGLSYKEIAAITGLTPSNVGFTIHNSIKKLRLAMVDTKKGEQS